MTEDFNKLIEQITDPADAAVVLIAGTAGFLLDAGLNIIGFLEPGYVGVTLATGALGIKKAIDVRLAKRKAIIAQSDKHKVALSRAQ